MNYDLGVESERENGIDIPTDITVNGEKVLKNDEHTEVPVVNQEQTILSETVKLRVHGKEFLLEIDDAQKIQNLFDRNNMTKIEGDGTSESFAAYQFIIGTSSFAVTEDMTRVEALIREDNDYISYVKQLTEEEFVDLKNILSKYKIDALE